MKHRTIEILEARIAPAFTSPLNLADFPSADGFRLRGEQPSDSFGTTVNSAGDFNDDGIGDLIVGASTARPGGVNAGAAYVIYGRLGGIPDSFRLADLDGTNGFKIPGDVAGEFFGGVVSPAGDVNGDDIDDLLVGAQAAPAPGDGGAAYVIFGARGTYPGGGTLNLSSLNGSNGFKISGAFVASAAGDFDGDGIDDVIAAAQGFGGGIGASFVIYGKASFAATVEVGTLPAGDGLTINGNAAEVRFGRSVAAAGDVNHDTFPDVIIGAPRTASDPGSGSGAAYVIFGSDVRRTSALNAGLLGTNDGFKIQGEDPGDFFGAFVGGAGDLNRDGIADFVIGATLAEPTGAVGENFGISYVILGRESSNPFPSQLNASSLNGTNGFRIEGAEAESFSGSSVGAVGDIDGDGIGDLALGAHLTGANDAGVGYVVFGRQTAFPVALKLADIDGSNGFKIVGAAANDQTGLAITAAGDVNGDGFADVIIGAAQPIGGPGAAYVIYGRGAPIGSLQLSASTYSVNENGGQLSFFVTRSGPIADAVSVQVASTDGSAVAGTDYTALFQVINFAAGDSLPKLVVVPIADNATKAADKTFSVALANASQGAVIGDNRSAVATIIDDETPPAIGFADVVLRVDENAGTATLLLNRTGARGNAVTISYTFQDGVGANGAVRGTHYKATDGTVTFGPNESSKTIPFEVINRADEHLDRIFSVTLGSPSAGVISGSPTADLTIAEVENEGVTVAVPGAPLVFTEVDGGQVEISISKGTLDRQRVVTIQNQAGEILIPLLDLSNNPSLEGARIVIREIAGSTLAAVRAPEPGLLAASAGIGVLGSGGNQGIPPSVGKLMAPTSTRRATTVVVLGDVVQVTIPEENKITFLEFDSFAAFKDKYGDAVNPGLIAPDSGVVGLRVNGNVTGVPISLPGGVSQFIVRGSVIDSQVTFGNKVDRFQVGNIVGSEFDLAAKVGTLNVLGGIADSKFRVHQPLTSLKVGGNVFQTDFFLEAGVKNVVIKGAARGSVEVGGTLGLLEIGGGLDDFGVKHLTEPVARVGGSLPSVSKLVIAGRAAGLTATAQIAQLTVKGSLDDSALTFPEAVTSLTVDELVDTTLTFQKGAKKVVVKDSVTRAMISSAVTLGAVTIGHHLLDSTISALGTAAPLSAAQAVAIKSLSVGGSVENSDILAGYEVVVSETSAGDEVVIVTARNPDVQIGALKVGGDWIASNVSAGIAAGRDTDFGTVDDVAIGASGSFTNQPGIVARIASIAIKGQVLGTTAADDQFGFAAEQAGTFAVGSAKFSLTSTADDRAVGATGDVHLHELGATLEVTPPTPDGLLISDDGKTATFTDVDGDLVTVKTSEGEFTVNQFIFMPAGNVGGRQLQRLELQGQPDFAGANLSITATRSDAGGDSFVNVGHVQARAGTTGIDLGKVTIQGDLGQIDAGDTDGAEPAVAVLKVRSLGRFGTATQATGGSMQSDLAGGCGALLVETDFLEASLVATGGGIGPVKVLGDVVRAVLRTDATLGAISIAFDLMESEIIALGPPGGTGRTAGPAIKSLAVGGSVAGLNLFAGSDGTRTAPNPHAAIGALTVAGDFTTSLVMATGAIGPVTILGDMLGVILFTEEQLGAVSVGFDLMDSGISALGLPAGKPRAGLAIKSVSVGGSAVGVNILAGVMLGDAGVGASAAVNTDAAIGAITIDGQFNECRVVAGVDKGADGRYGTADDRLPLGDANLVAKIASIQIGRTIIGGQDGFGFFAEEIGALKIGATVVRLTKGDGNDSIAAVGGASGVALYEFGAPLPVVPPARR